MEVKEEKEAECLQITAGCGDEGEDGRWKAPDTTPNNLLLTHM